MATAKMVQVVAVSDSLTNDESDNWLAVLARKSGRIVPVANAHGGWSTDSYFKEKFKDIAFHRVEPETDICIILVGSNNLFEAQGGSDAAIAGAVAGVQRIVARVQAIAPRARIVLVAPPTVALRNNVLSDPKPDRRIDTHSPGYLEKLGGAYRQLAAERGWPFIDLFPVLEPDDFADAAHPNPAGNRKIAEAMWTGLRPVIEEMTRTERTNVR